PGETEVSRDVNIEFYIGDTNYAVDTASIELLVNDYLVPTADLTFNSATDSYQVIYNPTSNFDWNEVVYVTINAENTNDDQMITANYSFTIMSDAVDPVITPVDPTSGGTNVDVETDIVIDITDTLSGVVSSSILVTVNGELAFENLAETDSNTYNVSIVPTTNGYRVSVDVIAGLLSAQTNTIDVYAEDSEANPTSSTYTFDTTTGSVLNISYDPNRSYSSIQAALDDALAGHTITLEADTYDEGAQINWPNTQNITLRNAAGGNSQNIAISGGGVRRVLYVGYAVTLNIEGICIKDGYSEESYVNGAGIYLTSGAELFLRNVIVSGNYIYAWLETKGAGINAQNARLHIFNCYFINNEVRSNPVFPGVNWKKGGAIYGGTNEIYNTIFKNNKVYNSGPQNSTAFGGALADGQNIIESCIFEGNIVNTQNGETSITARGGAISGGQNTINNTIFRDNFALNLGGAIYGSNARITNCTFVANTTMGAGGAIYDSTVQIKNSILWGNTPQDISVTTNTTVQYSNLSQVFTGIGNISITPNFINSPTADLRLSAHSPCIDRGTADATVTVDINGATRPQYTAYDMGAYETTEFTTFLHEPYPGSSNVLPSTNIEFYIGDTSASVNTSTIALEVNGYDVTNASLNITYEGNDSYKVIYDPTANFDFDEVVQVTINAVNNSAEHMVTASYYFTIQAENIPPTISPISPQSDEVAVPSSAVVVFEVLDTGSGIDINTLSVTMNGSLVSNIVSGSITNGYSVTCDVADFTYGETVTVDVYIADIQ
ncbi:choice-of-anchor Q domain-containing protein, partial [Candidatus Margulisiibacteriota bacterium]